MVSCDQDMYECFIIILQWFFFICIFKELFLLSIFYNVFFVRINKVSVLIGIVRMIYLVIWVFKVDWVYFGLMMNNFSLRKGGSVCISVFVEVFRSWFIFLLFWRSCSLVAFFLVNNGPLKWKFSNFPSFLSQWFFLRPQSLQYSFRYVIYDVLFIW